MAHVRWAAGSAITALDLCAAALGRLYCGITDDQLDLFVESARENHWKTLANAAGNRRAGSLLSAAITATRGCGCCVTR